LHKDRGRYTTTNKFKPIANATPRFCPRDDDILWGQSHVCLSLAGSERLESQCVGLTGLCRAES
jgi:hypothetical protein